MDNKPLEIKWLDGAINTAETALRLGNANVLCAYELEALVAASKAYLAQTSDKPTKEMG